MNGVDDASSASFLDQNTDEVELLACALAEGGGSKIVGAASALVVKVLTGSSAAAGIAEKAAARALGRWLADTPDARLKAAADVFVRGDKRRDALREFTRVLQPIVAQVQDLAVAVERGRGEIRQDLRDRADALEELMWQSLSATGALAYGQSEIKARLETILQAVGEPKDTGPSDLTISALDGALRVRALAGHPVLRVEALGQPVHTGGARVSFTLAHNGHGRHPIHLHAILPELVEFRPEPLASLSYRVAGGAVLGAGLTQPHVFAVTLRGATVDRSRWMPQQPAEQVQRSNSHDLLDTDPPRTFVFAPDGSGIEELQGTITARETGLYSVRFVFHYSVAGQDMRHTSLPVHIYKQG